MTYLVECPSRTWQTLTADQLKAELDAGFSPRQLFGLVPDRLPVRLHVWRSTDRQKTWLILNEFMNYVEV